MAIITNQNPRPITVKVVITFLLISVGLVIVKIATGVDWDHPLTYVIVPLALSMPLLLIWFIYIGENWARWIFVILVALGSISSIRPILQPHLTVALTPLFAQSVVQLIAAIALILPSSNKWFKGGAHAE